MNIEIPHHALGTDLFALLPLPYDPLAELARRNRQKDEVLKSLAEARAANPPQPALILAYEIWLRINHDISQTLSATPTYVTRSIPENDVGDA